MEWGIFSLAHIISMIIAIILIITVHFLTYKRSTECKMIVLFSLSMVSIGCLIYNLIAYNAPLEHLPLNICDIGAIIIPFVILFPRKGPANFLLINVLAAACGIIFNHTPELGYYSAESIVYYIQMVLAFGLPILIFTLDLSDLDIRYLPITLGVSILIYTLVYFFNLGINTLAEAHNILGSNNELLVLNYMGSIKPDNQILQAFYNLLPYRYWYMITGLGIDAIYLVLIYGIHNYVIRVRKTNEI